MSRKRLIVLMVFLLVVILSMGGYLWFNKSEVFRGKSVEKVDKIDIEEILEDAKRKPFDPSKPITKMVAVEMRQEGGVESEKGEVEYESVKSRYFIRGILLDDIEVVDGFLYGSFYIRGDKLEREIILTAGTSEGKIYFGYVEDNEDGTYDSSWKMADTEFASNLLNQGEEVHVEVEYDVINEPKEFTRQTVVLEALLDDVENDGNEYSLPVSFGIVTLKLGVVE